MATIEDGVPGLESLYGCIDRLHEAGVSTPHLECGPVTFELLAVMAIARMPTSESDYARQQIAAGRLQVTLRGVKVMMRQDVPEQRLWPPREVSVFAAGRKVRIEDDATGFLL